jgi:lipopolysaccharide heptosyltransferase II
MERKRILIFNVNWVGDVLFSTAVIRNIRYNYPDAFIACCIPSRCYQVLKGNPHLDEIIIFDGHDRHRGLLSRLRFVRLLRFKKFDVVYLLHRSFSRAFLCWLAGIPQRVGYYTSKRGFLLTKKISPLRDRDALHRIDYYLLVIEQGGLRVEDRYPEFFIGEDDIRFIADFFLQKKILGSEFCVGLNPGGNWGPKRWPAKQWALLADRLIQELGMRVIITGGAGDIALAEGIRRLMKAEPVIASGKLTLKQLGALCNRLDVFVTADTGPLHIANAVGTKRIIALFGPTHTRVTGPYPVKNVLVLQKDTGCEVPCYKVDCPDNRCMQSITVDEVFEHIRQYYASRNAS